MKNDTSKTIGVIVPDDGVFPLEIMDHRFITNWLAHHNLGDTEYILDLIPCDYPASPSVTEVELCEYLAAENVLSASARRLGNKGCHSVVFACTSASFFKGMQYAQCQAQLLSKSAGTPASSTSMAFLAALRVLGAKRVDILSPYPEITELLVGFLADAGVSVGRIGHMRQAPSGRAFDIDCEAELAEFVSSTTSSDHPIIIPCTSISSLNRAESFEKISGRSVITANQATLWHALVLAGLTPNIAGAGSLFRSYAQISSPRQEGRDGGAAAI
ncbi:MAG: hypothetical protein E5V89_03315 [Mesorhizobium sp.]|uniref:maleate cis-trans isomerase family protein n=1 Tax=Mesorhizobium sp. TaxID=1871066 RepID=UPI000FE90B60|nr:hypothetical protein [Mesorhizobium sp.]RWA59787.1 MAG: hypothetical protein EOQ28_32805 [Mesorhizobium sp.]TIS80291.1 MAG: hypothetical protein E5W94_01850 [Mesorhizobium sp.]TIV72864.1 MAG: hypothetical protein E5V89_03315 [Mesorhizobium sp.]